MVYSVCVVWKYDHGQCSNICTYTGVYVRQNGIFLANNSAISISDIGSADNNRVQCVTDRMPCCRSQANIPAVGEWFFPGDVGGVPILDGGATTFYRNRGDDGTVNLLRVSNDVMMPTGQFCCVVPDATGVNQWACVTIGEYNYTQLDTSAAKAIISQGYYTLSTHNT